MHLAYVAYMQMRGHQDRVAHPQGCLQHIPELVVVGECRLPNLGVFSRGRVPTLRRSKLEPLFTQSVQKGWWTYK